MPTILPLNEVKARLSEMVGRAADHHEEIVITVHGKPAAVLLSVYEYESLIETLEVLGNPDLMDRISDAEESADTVSHDEVAQALRERVAREAAAAGPAQSASAGRKDANTKRPARATPRKRVVAKSAGPSPSERS